MVYGRLVYALHMTDEYNLHIYNAALGFTGSDEEGLEIG